MVVQSNLLMRGGLQSLEIHRGHFVGGKALLGHFEHFEPDDDFPLVRIQIRTSPPLARAINANSQRIHQ